MGRALGDRIASNAILLFYGELGAGKTSFIQGLVDRFVGCDVTSPTFSYVQIYQGLVPFFHFDLYRLGGESDFFDLGLDEYFSLEGIKCVEWPQKAPYLEEQEGVVKVSITYEGETKRKIVVQ